MSELKKLRSTKHKRSKGAKKPSDKSHETEDTVEKIIIDDVSRLYQKRGLESNWYRYEPREDDTEDRSRDFTLLSSAPISAGGYFQFKNDNIEAKPIENKAFHLDLTLLSKSIATVPFHVRCGIDEKYFSETAIKAMNDAAKKNVSKYDEYLETLNRKKNAQMGGESASDGAVLKVIHDAPLIDEIKDTPDRESKIECVDQKYIREGEGTKHAGDLEQWLDDILDD